MLKFLAPLIWMLLVLDFNQRNAFNPILAISNNEINNIWRKNENTSFFISFFCYFLPL